MIQEVSIIIPMKNTHLAKTLTASLPGTPQDVFAYISNPNNLSAWHSSFCRAVRAENTGYSVESPRGAVPVRFLRDDHTLVLDILAEVSDGIELASAIRLLSNGQGTEMVWTLVKPEGLSDSVFHEQLRWAGSALHNLRKLPKSEAKAPAAAAVISSAPADSSTAAASSDALSARAEKPVDPAIPLTGKKLFVGNLSYDWQDEQLRTHFAEQGTIVLAEVARFRGRGGRSRGFGFVEMSSEAEAQTAIEKLHGGLAGGREVIVRLAKSQESRPQQPAAPTAKESAPISESSAPAEEPIEPGNRKLPDSPAPIRHRGERTRRGPAPSRPAPAPRQAAPPAPRRLGGGRPRASGVERPYVEHDISNKSGYEIFPRRAPGSTEPPTPTSSTVPARPQHDPSPYMDDTGDIENHGPRQSRNNRRR